MGKLSLSIHASPRADAVDGPYRTELSPGAEAIFRNWLKANSSIHPAFAEFNPDDPKSDYDMRGWFAAAANPQDPMHERTGLKDSTNSVMPHFDDYWKTPYHAGFSNESQWAIPGKAPGWKKDGYGGWNLNNVDGTTAKAEPNRALRVHMPEDGE